MDNHLFVVVSILRDDGLGWRQMLPVPEYNGSELGNAGVELDFEVKWAKFNRIMFGTKLLKSQLEISF